MRIVEHVFVTEQPWPQARATLAALLKPMGLRLASTCLSCGGSNEKPRFEELDATCPECRRPRRLTFSTQLKSSSRETTGLTTPLFLTIEYQKGRVEVAAAIDPPSYSRKELDRALLQLANGVEAVLGRGADVRHTLHEWWSLELIPLRGRE